MSVNWEHVGSVLAPGLGALASLATLYGVANITSNLRTNVISRGKNQADLLEDLIELTTSEYAKEPHPLLLQAKFNGAFGSTPEGEEIRHLLNNEKIATFEIIKSFVRYLKYVAYDPAQNTFAERPPLTSKALTWKWRWYFVTYLLFGLFRKSCG